MTKSSKIVDGIKKDIIGLKDKATDKVKSLDVKKFLIMNIPFVLLFIFATRASCLYRLSPGAEIGNKLMYLMSHIEKIVSSLVPSFAHVDMLVALGFIVVLKLMVKLKKDDAKKMRKGIEYGSARWGTAEDIKPFMSDDPQMNIPLTATESLTMESRPKKPKYARNKNVLVIGGSGSGKTRFFVKPSLMQCHSSYVLTDPKSTLVAETAGLMKRQGYVIKVLNTINFKKSMHYNPLAYIHSEKDILKLVNTIIANTKGEGEKSGEDFWVKAEKLYYTALISFIWYEGTEDEKNFITLLDLINASEAREDDEEFKNPVDLLFEELESREPEHFAVRQYKKYKMAAGVISFKRLFNTLYQ